MRGGGGEECICVLQLTEAGDILYQILEPEQSDKEATTSGRNKLQPHSQTDNVSDMWSDEDVIGPTQAPTALGFVAETPEREQRATDSEDSDSGGRNLTQVRLQVFVNDDPQLDRVSRLDAGVKDGKVGKDNADKTECQARVKLSDGALLTWKHWLQKLMHKSREKKPRPRRLQHLTVQTSSLVHLSDDGARDRTEEERVQSLRRDLRACMSKRSLLVSSSSIRAPDVVTVPDPVETAAWTDQISHRLTVSWQGEKAWRAWWEDQLGLNREQKVEALRRKRRREKEARRASGRRLELSGSFTSSVSYQSELSSFSDSATGGWSDAEGQGSQLPLEDETPRASTPSVMQTDTPVPTPTATPQKVIEKQGEQQTPSSSRTLTLSQTPKPDSTPTNQRRSRRPVQDYLSSLFAPQVRDRCCV